MRDLASKMDDLTPSDEREAGRILARPTDGSADVQGHGYTVAEAPPVCDTKTNENTSTQMDLCFHWVTSTDDAPPLSDSSPGDGVPDYVDLVRATFDDVWEREINDLDFRSPRKDGTAGGNSGLDIYLADVGEDGIYGYCTNDDPEPSSRRQSAYCVIDNDFAQADFEPNVYGTDALQVTAAHEFLHAVQFAYDWQEKKFFMEGTAVWIEDEVFDDVNANYEYLHDSALHQPEVPLDGGDYRPDENFEYGSWLFWRFLNERFPGPLNDSARTIRQLWEEAASSSVFDAMDEVLRDRNSNIANTYADFAEWNRIFDEDNTGLVRYDEGFDYMQAVNFRYPPTDAEFWLGPDRPKTGPRNLRLDHLSMRYVLIQPNTLVENGTDLKVDVDADLAGSRARLIRFVAKDENPVPPGDTYPFKWCVQAQTIQLNKAGEGSRRIPFLKGRCGGEDWPYSMAYLVLVNGGFKDNARFDYDARIIP
jgi:hypothetical protein